jgi:predicted transcriptional regulator of viral defense system
VTNSSSSLETLARAHGGLLTVGQAHAHGFDRQHLVRATRRGQLERVQRGVYRLVGADIAPFEAELEVQLRVPHAVIALGNALAFHGLTTFMPKTVEVSLERGRKMPALAYPRVKVYFDAAPIHRHGIEEHLLNGYTVRVYSPEKTLMDLLRRDRESLYAEGMQGYLTRPGRDFPALLQAARVCRVESRVLDLLRVEGSSAVV